ncbi:hypothetical protein [Actinoplanes sp. NPDC026619]|uniref:hypothetical protein n=1 Tax=Actinoplanes sp. NPDC026619 TaxID=3155798 RepID=UPI00340AA656
MLSHAGQRVSRGSRRLRTNRYPVSPTRQPAKVWRQVDNTSSVTYEAIGHGDADEFHDALAERGIDSAVQVARRTAYLLSIEVAYWNGGAYSKVSAGQQITLGSLPAGSDDTGRVPRNLPIRRGNPR